MNKQNSSKLFPKMLNAQGIQINFIKVSIQGIIKQLTSKDFFELNQIINPANSSQLKIQGLYTIISNTDSITILHIFIYYCIKVTQSLQIYGIDEHYLKLLCNLYISSGFNIEISRYAHLVSKTTSIPLRKCIHILLASNSYVNSIISQLAPKSQNKRQRLKMILSTKIINKKQKFHSSPVSNILEKQKYTDFDDLTKDLRQIFERDVKEKDQKTKFREWLSNQQKENQDQQNCWDTEKRNKNISKIPERKYYLNFFPNRVFNDQKSAILEKIVPNLKSNYKLMRKRKFDDSKIQKMLNMTFNTTFQHDHKVQRRQMECSLAKQRSKIFTHNIIQMNDKFKQASTQLDKIRCLITQESKKRTQHQHVGQKNQVLSNIQKQYFELIEKKQKKQEEFQETHHQTLTMMQYQTENTIINLLRKQQKNNNSLKKDSDLFYSKQIRNRKLFNSSRTTLEDKSANKVLHSLCQSRVYKYKNQYRKFLKLHLFQHQNDESR